MSEFDWIGSNVASDWGTKLDQSYNRAIGGNDTINAGEGNDYVHGGGGDDIINAGEGGNTIYGGLGADTITAGSGADSIRGGDGSLDPGVDASDTINAGAGNDTIWGEGGNDTIYAEGGNDTAYGGDGDDTIYGAEGSDTLYGQAGDDTLDGGIDNDIMHGGIGEDTLTGGIGNDELYGDDQGDILDAGDGDDTIEGGTGADTITGGLGADTIDGGTDADTINAGGGNDTIDGGTGNDTINAGDGDDTIEGGTGADTITGGAGTDRFVFTYQDFLDDQIDVITDFTTGNGGDVLDLTNLHTENLAAGFGDEWSGSSWAYSHGYIQFAIDGDDTLVSYDQDGWYDTYSAQSFIRLTGVNLTSLAAVNAEPDPNDDLYKIEPAAALSEDSNAAVNYRVVLGKAPTDDVIISITGGDQINVTGSGSLTFNSDNWYIPQTVRVTAVDDLIIERDHTASLTHSFSSADTDFNTLPDAVGSVLITDNDFQRSIDLTKVPSEAIIRSFMTWTECHNQWYTHS